jgi:hypothetical protein
MVVGMAVHYEAGVDSRSGKPRARKVRIADKKAPEGPQCYGKDELLSVYRALRATAQLETTSTAGPRNKVYLVRRPDEKQGPGLNDEARLARMESRLSRESGIDRKNSETFGDCVKGWSFEEAATLSSQLFRGKHRTRSGDDVEDIQSTAAGTASEKASSASGEDLGQLTDLICA